MEVLHLESCPSTSQVLKEKLQSGEIKGSKFLLSTKQQTAGVGRKGNEWDSPRQRPWHLAFYSIHKKRQHCPH